MPYTKTKSLIYPSGYVSIYREKTKINRRRRAGREMIALICLIALEIWAINALSGINAQAEDKTPQIAKFEAKEQIKLIAVEIPQTPDIIRTVTAYNVGDPSQTDDTPCIGAYSKIDLCQALKRGEHICASNEFPKGTILEIENLGRCVVLDKMNARYKNRIDWAMGADEKDRALEFGVQNLKIKVIK